MIARQMDRDIVGKYPAQLINVASMYALNGPHHPIYEGMPFKSFSLTLRRKRDSWFNAMAGGILGKTYCTVNTIAPGAVLMAIQPNFKNALVN